MYLSSERLNQYLNIPEVSYKIITLWDNKLIVLKCGYVFKKDIHTKKWKLMNFNKPNGKYKRINLYNNNKEILRVYIHRLVYYAFNQSIFDIFNSSVKTNTIDHINGDTSDNRLSNLRNVSNQENHFNKKCKGYCYRKDRNEWEAKIMLNRKTIHLGRFDTKWEARLCYLLNKRFYHKIK